MMSNLILTVLVLLTVGVSILWAFLRGLGKARIRGISVLVCAIAAVLITVLLRGTLVSDAMIQDTVVPWLEAMEQTQIIEMLGLSNTLNEVLLNCIYSLISPLICVLVFAALSFLSWFVFLIVTLIIGDVLREHNAKCKFSRTRAIIWGAVQGLVIVVIMLLPVSVYLDTVPTVMQAVADSDVLGESEEEVQSIMDGYVLPMEKNGLIVAYRAVGGKALAGVLTDFNVSDARVHLSDELDSVASFACNVIRLANTDITLYGSNEAAVFIAIADSFEDSVLLPTIAGEVIYGATDAWLQNNAFLGIVKPEFGDMNEIFVPFFDTLLTVLRTDARNTTALQADIRTVAEMVSTLSNHGVFANFSDTEKLMEALSSQGIVNSLITTLGSNESMKVLIPEITNMGVRAIATTLGIPADVDAVYGDFLDDVAGAINDVRDLEGEARVEALTVELKQAFDNAGIPIDQEIVDCYSVSMVEDLIESSDKEELTSEDIQAFFAVYALNVEEEAVQSSTEGLSATGTLPLNGSDIFAGTVYEGKTEEELNQSGAAALAQATQMLAKVDPNGDISTQARSILQNAYSDLLGENSAELEKLMALELSTPLSETGVQVTAGLQSSEKMVTQIITLNELLVDANSAAANINSETIEKESQAIAAIFSAASDLTKKDSNGEEMNLTEVAGSVGGILDALNETESFGSDKTAGLFTAVLQSETVRKNADMDMTTATQMAQKATEGGGNYTQTMSAVSTSVDILTKLGNDNEKLTDDELVQLIRDLNPQTAGMIEVYVTPARIVSYGVAEKHSDTSAALISTTFSYLAHATLSEEEFEKEAKALNQILTIAITAKSHSSGRKLFGEVLPSATETVNTFMSSKALSYSLKQTLLDENGNVLEGKFDVFELSERIPENSADYLECVQAMTNYYNNAPTEENRQTLTAISALLGVPFQAS